MLQIWIGRAGSGKSRRILEEIGSRRHQRRQVLIVPEHASHEAELDLCRACGATASRDAEVLSFRSLSSRVLTQTGGLSDFTLDSGGKLLTMRLVLQEIHSQLKVFGKPSQRAAFLRQLVELADEFYAYEVAPEELYTQVAELPGAAGDKLRDLALLYAAYDGKLRAGGIDRRSRIQKLAEQLEQADYMVGKDVYFDGFSYFNAAEEHILAVLLRQAHDVTVTLLGDRGDTLFQNASAQRERLVRLAREAGVPCEIVHLNREAKGALGHLERGLFGSDAPYEGETAAISLYEASAPFTEVEYVAAQIRRLVCQEGYRYREIGVTARNMEVYAPILENVFARDGIPAYISRRSDILAKPVLTLLLSALDAVTGGFTYEDMFRYLKTGMAGITPEECDLLENYVITWEIHGNMWLRETPWTASPFGRGQGSPKEQEERLRTLHAIRQKVRLPLLRLSEGLKAADGAKSKVKALYSFAEETGVPGALQEKAETLLAAGQVQLAEEYGQLWRILCGVLDQFVEILGDMELGGEEFARLLRLVLTQYSVGTIPATLDQVKVSDITRNDRHPVRCLFLLGANDGVLPQVEHGGGVLDEEARELLQQRKILLSDATFDALDNELQNIYACLAQPTERLRISYSATDGAGGELRPSFVVERVETLFPSLRIQKEDRAYRRELPATALELAGQEPYGALWRYFSADGQYGRTLAGMERARLMRRGKLSPEAVQTLYGKSLGMSASRLDRLRSCHFSYFMEYGLRARERRSAGLEPSEVGTLLHYLLEHVTREVMEQGGFHAVERAELRRMVDRWLDRYADEVIGSYGEKSARFRYLFSRLRFTAMTVVENVAAELAESDFRPVELELGFGVEGAALPAVTIREADATLSVRGKVDRVDGWIHDGKLYVRVVDYKTGKKTFDLSDLQEGLGIQMLLYLFALRSEGEAYFGMPVVPAGVSYLPAREEILSMDRNASEQEVEKAMKRALRRTGLVLNQPEVLQAMEHSALEHACYLPVTFGSGGKSITGGLASAEQLGKLSRYVDKLLHQIAAELRRGNVDADPWARGPQESACTYCPFASACFFDEKRDRLRRIGKVEEESFWRFVDKAVGEEERHG